MASGATSCISKHVKTVSPYFISSIHTGKLSDELTSNNKSFALLTSLGAGLGFFFLLGLGGSVGGREPAGVEGVFVRLRLLINNLFVL